MQQPPSSSTPTDPPLLPFHDLNQIPGSSSVHSSTISALLVRAVKTVGTFLPTDHPLRKVGVTGLLAFKRDLLRHIKVWTIADSTQQTAAVPRFGEFVTAMQENYYRRDWTQQSIHLPGSAAS